MRGRATQPDPRRAPPYTGGMSVTTRRGVAWSVALLVALLTAGPVAAHAELTTSDPTDGSEVPGPFEGPVTLSFSEELADNSRAQLLDEDGDAVAEATPDPARPDELVIELEEPLAAGAYRVQITAVADDGHIERPVVEFTVLEAEPTPTPAPATVAPSASSSPTPPPTAAPAPTPAPSADGSPTAGASDVLFPILAALIALAVLGAMLLRSRRNRQA